MGKPEVNSSAFGIVVRQKRCALNMTAERLAEIVDMSDREIRNIEKGRTVPKLDTAIKIGDALNIDLGVLNDPNGKKNSI